MKRTKTSNWLATAALLPLLAGSLSIGCDDDDESGTDAAAGRGGSGGTGGTGGGTGGTGGGTGGTGGGTGGTGGGADAGDVATGDVPAGCAAEVLVNDDVTADTTWSCPVYVLKKKIYVIAPAKLTIDPGTVIKGDPLAADKTALIVTRGGQLLAKGTKDKPVVFTSGAAATMRKGGDWAGVALLGDAKINSGAACANGMAGCLEAGIEGIPATETKAKFGGLNDAGSCGELNYVRIEFAGAELAPMNELNGLTLGGCGSGTKLSYIQVHRGTDDGIEFFGGTASMDHVVLTGNEDDSLDWDYGWTGKVQFLVIHQRAGFGDYGIEGAGSPMSETATPRTDPLIYNMTMVGQPTGGKAAINFKQGTRGKIYNSVVTSWKTNTVDFAVVTGDFPSEWPMYLTIENSVFFGNAWAMEATDNDKGFNDQMAVEDAARKNQTTVDPGLTATGDLTMATVTPNYVPPATATGLNMQATPPAPFVTTATYAGAFAPGDAAPWTAGWTAYPIN